MQKLTEIGSGIILSITYFIKPNFTLEERKEYDNYQKSRIAHDLRNDQSEKPDNTGTTSVRVSIYDITFIRKNGKRSHCLVLHNSEAHYLMKALSEIQMEEESKRITFEEVYENEIE